MCDILLDRLEMCGLLLFLVALSCFAQLGNSCIASVEEKLAENC